VITLDGVIAGILLFSFVACREKEKEKSFKSPSGKAYILKQDAGDLVLGGDSSLIVKVSPEQGSANNITIVQKIKPGKGTGLHYHKDADEIFYVMEGNGIAVLDTQTYNIEAGDFIFIEPGVPHEVCNLSDTEPVVAVVARSDASEWENIVDYPSTRRPVR
jgi:quercetin dioxygenase-like cupin family protein